MSANEREILIGFGKNKQAALATANTAAGMIRLRKLNTSNMYPTLNTENDAEELGKGHGFATQVFKTAWDLQGQIEKYLSAEFAAWAMAFSLGSVVKTGTTPNFVYTCTPLDPPTEGIELPNFSFVEQMRPGASAVVDHMCVGCAIEGWTLTVGSGPGRANSKLVVDIIGSGKLTEPSAISLPSATSENLLPSASLSATINSVDYVTAKNFVSLEASWKNNHMLDDGYYPGSGFQTAGVATSGALRGRLEIGTPELALKFVSRFEYGSTEYTKFKAQTEGSAVIDLQYDANNYMTLTYPRLVFSMVERGGQNGIVTVEVTCQPLYHTSNGILTAECGCSLDEIAEAES